MAVYEDERRWAKLVAETPSSVRGPGVITAISVGYDHVSSFGHAMEIIGWHTTRQANRFVILLRSAPGPLTASAARCILAIVGRTLSTWVLKLFRLARPLHSGDLSPAFSLEVWARPGSHGIGCRAQPCCCHRRRLARESVVRGRMDASHSEQRCDPGRWALFARVVEACTPLPCWLARC